MQVDKLTEEYVPEEYLEYEGNQGWFSKIKNFINGRHFLALIGVLFIVLAFILGRLSVMKDSKSPVKVRSTTDQRLNQVSALKYIQNGSEVQTDTAISSQATVVGSKSGKKYHYSWCAGAKQISKDNLITFGSIEEARAKGYTPALNCKGLK